LLAILEFLPALVFWKIFDAKNFLWTHPGTPEGNAASRDVLTNKNPK
jgi:hypothetical protein